MQAEPEVLFEKRGRAGIITLNRPRALNALTLAMIRDMHAELASWAEDAAIERVVIRGAGEKAFCAGGDIRQVRELGLRSDPEAVGFFRDEYRLNALIKRFPKPYVALIDGAVMGGGVGVSVHGSHRICGERTAFAMPEAGIGFFPDVGATYFLPRLPGRLGAYLGLTGARLGQADALWSGIATHAVPRARFDDLAESLAEATDIAAAIDEHAAAPRLASIVQLMPAIDRCFAADSVEAIMEALDRETGEHWQWAAQTADALRLKSPLSLKIALRQMREGRHASFAECMRIEFRIVSRVLQGTDFYEGVRALILDKDNQPHWTHASVETVGKEEVDRYFAPLGPDELELSVAFAQ
ncbi:MAG: enoyl-CoA hydratase/isomerase family protein [Pseudomonadota bacterium]|nr:enoyl-CoA hydratase/isomerase family protein [Pseudomonadota bacterium]